MALTEYTGLVVKRIPYRESDLIVWLVTREAGLVSAIAVAARKSRKRFSNLFDIGNLIEVKATLRRKGMPRLDSGMLVDGFWELSQSVQALAATSHVVELTRRFSVEGQAEPEIVDLAVAALDELTGKGVGQFILRAFEVKLLVLAGLAPNLEHCVSCQKVAAEKVDALFSIPRSGIVCGNCRREGEGRPLPAGARSLMRKIMGAGVPDLFGINFQPECLPPLNLLVPALLEYHLGGPLRSLRFARHLPRPEKYAAGKC